MHRRLPSTVALAAVLCAFATAVPHAETDDPYVAFHNMDTFERDGEQIRALRLPLYITLRSWQDGQTGLRLRLAASAAAADLFDLLEQGLTEVRVLSFVPGIEFVFPVGNYHVLRPYLDAGIGTNNYTNDRDFLGAIGLRTELIFPRGHYIFGAEPGIQFSYNSGTRDNRVFNPFVTLSARRVLGMEIASSHPDAEVYFEAGYDFQTFEIASVRADDNHIVRKFEVGLGFGFSRNRPRIGPFAVPRLRVGYRFGDLEGFRFRVGGDWLSTLSPR